METATMTLRASTRPTKGNSPLGVARSGLIDRRAQTEPCSALRPDTPTQNRVAAFGA
jgi:hypothetical protein